ncbi:MAG: 3'-5' exonuclease, partial [Bdellovibrionales bacterium]|nr:3'-5' exonuclease [Bdellovibrionales bacterium]
MRFVAFDFETTGFLPGVEQITEIGAVRFVDGAVDAKFCTLVNPGKPIPPTVVRITGIDDEMVKSAPKIEDLLESLAQFCG